MVKVIAVIRRREGLSREEFLHLWQQDHPAHIRNLPGIRRYVQSPTVDDRPSWPYDGAAELWFDSVRDVAAAFDSPAAEGMREHEKAFIGELQWFLADEIEIDLGASA